MNRNGATFQKEIRIRGSRAFSTLMPFIRLRRYEKRGRILFGGIKI
jgi:hypothetical protein